MQNTTVKDLVKACGGILLCGDENAPVEHISLDSRTMEGNDLFVPLIGEKVDAHRFIAQALHNGAVAVLTSEHGPAGAGREPVPVSDSGEAGFGKAWIAVEDTKLALQNIGRWYRKKLTLPLVGITGSVGKTTTKEMVAAALSGGLRTYKTRGSRNSQVGVPITITDIDKEDQIGVIELGMSEPGELTVIAQMAQVETALITNIGVAHINQLGSQENIFREKMTIQDGLKEGGILLLNGDDPFLAKARAREGFRTIYYGTGDNCDYRAVDIHTEKGYPVFTAVCRRDTGAGELQEDRRCAGLPGVGDIPEAMPCAGTPRTVTVRLKVMGAHQILNAIAALAVADLYGVSLEAAAAKLGEYAGMKGRQQVHHADGITVIDDSYNANPVSMKVAIDILDAVEDVKRRVAVLADMKELGGESPRFHREAGAYLASKSIDLLVTYGELAEDIETGALDWAADRRKAERETDRTEGHEASQSAGRHAESGTEERNVKNGLQVRHFAESEKKDMMEWLEKELREGDCVLFKGSNSMNLGEAADYVCQRHH